MADNSIEIAEQIPASKKLGDADAASLLKSASKLYVAKGKKLSEFSADEKNTAAITAMLGPTGNLRAPTIVKGKTLIVGFNEDLFAEQLG